ncbi:hypothetical protein JCM21142_104282 [Saccharicrinis fermentans DSM 9555 = JCM 21142]|uniref:Uncharacterized protein n=1 Tax=Saccharicrinis fermentans DSM 9555 = JCM 21142 TaxID=869213 RepID=W7YDI7_9BACT|nr:hypothetical protein JCM21142_104282 [Saccharicrinis fermentans DSM 9555 = JCM 21142]
MNCQILTVDTSDNTNTDISWRVIGSKKVTCFQVKAFKNESTEYMCVIGLSIP